MAVIKQIQETMNLKKGLSGKIPVTAKWAHHKKRIAQRLNNRTKNWKAKQQKQFLLLFSIGFMAILFLSFGLFTQLPYQGTSIPVSTLRQKVLLPEKQVLKTLLPPKPPVVCPPLLDSCQNKK